MKRSFPRQLVQIVALLGPLALLLLGCHLGVGGAQTDLASNQTLKMGWTTHLGLAGLDPVIAQEPGAQQIASLLFDGLVALDQNGRVEPWDADQWTISADGLTYTFTLRPDLFFSDGVPVKASDYAWSLDRALNSCRGSALAYDLAAIKDAAAFSNASCVNGQVQGSLKTLVGDSLLPDNSTNTLKIVLARPAGYFLTALATPAGFVLERTMPDNPNYLTSDELMKLLASSPEGQGGSGMFYVTKWSSDEATGKSTLALKPNPHWWGQQFGKIPHFSEVDVTFSASPSDSPFVLFQADPSQAFADSLPKSILSQGPAALAKQDYYHSQPIGSFKSLVFNWALAPFDDLNARKAFCLAINRDQFDQQLNAGQNLPSWHLVPQGMAGYNEQLKGIDGAPTTGNAALAKQYWQQYLDAHGGIPPIKAYISSSDSSLDQATLQMMQQTWARALNVSVQPFVVGIARLDANTAKAAQIFNFGWNIDYPDPQDFLTTLYSSGSVWNEQQASVPAADALMRQADALYDAGKRAQLYHQAEQLLIDNVAVCPLYQSVNHYALRPWVKGGFTEDARGLIPNDAWVTGYIAKH